MYIVLSISIGKKSQIRMAGCTVDWSALKGLDVSNRSLVTVECTVVTGFEKEAEKEAKQKLGLGAVEKTQGRIVFDIEGHEIGRCLDLRSVDNVWVVIGAFKEVKFDQEKDANLSQLVAKIDELDWNKGLDAWKRVSDFKGALYPKKEKTDAEEDQNSNGEEPKKRAKHEEDESSASSPLSVPLFRCTCYRSVNLIIGNKCNYQGTRRQPKESCVSLAHGYNFNPHFYRVSKSSCNF